MNKKVSILSNTIMNILRNWLKKAIKSLIQEKKTYLKDTGKVIITSSCYSAYDFFKKNWIHFSVSKQRISTKLTKFQESLKAYWSLLKTFLNNKKISSIQPLYHQDDLVTNLKKRLNFPILFLLVSVLWLKMIIDFPLICIIRLTVAY